MTRSALGGCWLLLASLLLGAGHLLAQHPTYIGRNLVAVRPPSSWFSSNTTHFELNFYERNRELAALAGPYAEDAYLELQKTLEYRGSGRFQLFVYTNPADFLHAPMDQYIPRQEEFHINRISVYFQGSQADFYTQIKTQLARCMLEEMFYGGGPLTSAQNKNVMQVPDWLSMGMAYYLGEGWTPQDEGYLRGVRKKKERYVDEVLASKNSGQLITLKKSIWHFVATSYGRRKLGEIAFMTRLTRSVENGVGAVLGMSLQTLTLRWVYFVESNFPDERLLLKKEQSRLTLARTTRLVAQSLSPDGTRLAYLTERKGHFQLQWMELATGKRYTTPVSFGARTDLNIVHGVDFPLCWGPDGRTVLLAGLDRNQLALIYHTLGGSTETFPIANRLDWIAGLAWSKDDKVLLAGALHSHTDLYLLAPRTTTLLQLTTTPYDELNPAWDATGRRFFFTSNGGDSLLQRQLNYTQSRKAYDIFELPFPSRGATPIRLTFTPYANEWNLQTVGERLYFLSDETGISNVATQSLLNNNADVNFLTNLNTGATSLSVLPTGAFITSNVEERDHLYQLPPLEPDRNRKITRTRLAQGRQQAYLAELVAKAKLEEEKQRKDSLRIADSLRALQPNPSDSTVTQRPVIKRNKPTARFYLFDEQEDTLAAQKRENSPIASRVLRRPRKQPKLPPPFDINRVALGRLRKPDFGLDLRELHLEPYWDPIFRAYLRAELVVADTRLYHKFTAGFSGFYDFQSSDMSLDYEYSKFRIHPIAGAKKSSRYFTDPGYYRYNSSAEYIGLAYPINRFQSVSVKTDFIRINRNDLNYNLPYNANYQNIGGSSKLQGLHFTYLADYTRMIGHYTAAGTRWELKAESYYGNYGGASKQWGYSSLSADVRKYVSLGNDVVVALRASGAYSPGPRSQLFMMGGQYNWIFPNFDNRQEIPIAYRNASIPSTTDAGFVGNVPLAYNVEDFYFTSFIAPVRGFAYNARNGNKFMLINAEIRVPLRKLFSNTLTSRYLYNTQIMAFYDAGSAWTAGNPLSGRIGLEGTPITVAPFTYQVTTYEYPFLQGFGAGLRTLILGYSARADVALGIANGSIGKPQLIISLGKDF